MKKWKTSIGSVSDTFFSPLRYSSNNLCLVFCLVFFGQQILFVFLDSYPVPIPEVGQADIFLSRLY